MILSQDIVFSIPVKVKTNNDLFQIANVVKLCHVGYVTEVTFEM